MRHEPVAIGELVRRVGQAFSQDFGTGRDERCELLLDLGTEEARVVGDSHRIEQIINALLARAAGIAEAATLRFRVQPGRVEIEVEGDGWGPRIDALVDSNSDGAGRYQRAGRGLAIAEGLTEAMGGTLAYETRGGAMRAFVLALPTVSTD